MNRHERRKQEAQERKPHLRRFEPSPPVRPTLVIEDGYGIVCGCAGKPGASGVLNWNPRKKEAWCPTCGARFHAWDAE